jgi:cytochrome b
MSKNTRLIWDLPLRLFHWSFVVTILALWYTAEQGSDLVDIHMLLGYVALGLLIFRVLWGFIGPKHARFSQFIPSPKQLINYLRNKDVNEQSAGHNPLGALMVVLMILLVSTQAISGLFINDDVFSAGPYNSVVPADIEKIMSFLHHNTFDLTLIAIGLHIGAILYYALIKKLNLVTPMITGKKEGHLVDKSAEIPHSKLWRALIVAIFCIGFIYWLVVINAPVIEDFYY